jgi:hypothetical protein
MISLSNNWITEPLFDLEYKQYLVMGYLQQKEQALYNGELFPNLKEISRHTASLNYLSQSFQPGIVADEIPEALSCVRQLIDFSIPRFSAIHKRYADMEAQWLDGCSVALIGLYPFQMHAGYLLIQQDAGLSAFAYSIRNALSAWPYEQVVFDDGIPLTETNPERARVELYDLVNTRQIPATFFLISSTNTAQASVQHTLLPLGGRLIYDYVMR